MSYTAGLHQHRLASWAAATAASASSLCRFTVQAGVNILEKAGFNELLSLKDLPGITDIDAAHKKWRSAVMNAASMEGITFTDGIAAKLINCYLKVRFVCGPDADKPHVRALHPPIDRILLDGLARRNVGGFQEKWKQANRWAWSKFTSDQYQEVIDHVRLVVGDEMWKIEEYWQGFQ